MQVGRKSTLKARLCWLYSVVVCTFTAPEWVRKDGSVIERIAKGSDMMRIVAAGKRLLQGTVPELVLSPRPALPVGRVSGKTIVRSADLADGSSAAVTHRPALRRGTVVSVETVGRKRTTGVE